MTSGLGRVLRPFAAAVLALGLAACQAIRPAVTVRGAPGAGAMVAGGEAVTGGAAVAGGAAAEGGDVRPGEPLSLAVITIRWPDAPRKAQSLAPATDRVKFELRGPAPPGLSISDLVRPPGGSLTQTVSIQVPTRQGIQLRATGFGAGAVVGQSLWTTLELRPNARIDVAIELLPASGPDLLRAVLLSPRIDSVTPDRGYPVTTQVTVVGANFGYGRGLGAVSFGGVEAGDTPVWIDSAEGATLSARVPLGALTGPVVVRVGRSGSPATASWPVGATAGDPWSGHFTVLGPAGDPVPVASGSITDYRLAFDGTQRRFWVVFAKGGTLSSGASGVQLFAVPYEPSPEPVASLINRGKNVCGPLADQPCPVADPFGKAIEAQGMQVGGVAPDANGLWLTWQERTQIGSVVKFGHLATTGFLDKVGILSTSPADSAQPVITRSPTDGTMLAAWIDNRDTTADAQRPRIYTQILASDGRCGVMKQNFPSGRWDTTFGDSCPGTANPAQESNNRRILSNLSRVANLTVATNGVTFLVGWQETGTDTFALEFQRISTAGLRFFSQLSLPGFQFAGPTDPDFQNVQDSASQRSLEEPSLVWNSRDKEYLVAYTSRQGGSTGKNSDIYVDKLDDALDGKPVSTHQLVSDDSRTQGQAKCPSFDPGVPCGQGLRTKPQLVWNGRDYTLAWQFDRDDGETDILGARIGRTAQGNYIRTIEEPPSPQASTTLPRSVAEIVYSFLPGGGYGQTLAGAQTGPRLVWGSDVMVVGWLEPKDGANSVLSYRLWR